MTPIGNTTRNHPDNEEFDSTIADYLEVIDQIERELIDELQREMGPNNGQPTNESSDETYLKSVTNREITSTDLFVETLKTMYYWPHMRAEVQAMVEDREGRNDFRPSLSREPHNAAMR